MIRFFSHRMFPLLALCSLSAPAPALDLPGSAANPVTRQVEKKAEQMVERAIDRQVEQQVASLRQRLADLPRSLPIRTSQGQPAFNDVVLDDGFRAVQRQWMVTVTDSEIASLDQTGITIVDRQELTNLGMTVVRFTAADRLDSREALQRALPELADRLDRNHVFAPQAGLSASGTAVPRWGSLCEDPVRVGMVDTAIDTGHPVLRNVQIVQERFLALANSDGNLSEPRTHGTAVASLMVGSREGQWPARLPAATVFNASVFYSRDDSLSGATLNHLLQGLNWLADQELSVINISLAGPDNRLLASAVRSLRQQGIVLVAAVGNQGPSAPPLYPAAYPEVVGVTAVDALGQLYRWANQGEQVLFAGPGVSVPVAHPEGGMVTDSGTSLAAPVVAAALACQRVAHPHERSIEALLEQVRDLGEPGRDTRFGHGLLDL
ncbi:S8 family serine peptidase [Marinobacter sp.]|uniref:S8 family serine peptidase n=1 Tax=Marinobacter sp. TaxID=50741 RepID=UPI0034A3FDD9